MEQTWALANHAELKDIHPSIHPSIPFCFLCPPLMLDVFVLEVTSGDSTGQMEGLGLQGGE